MASLFESIVQQNLSVLTRGHTLRPTVLLLGGPNFYIKGLRDCWKRNLPLIWEERGVELPDPTKAPEDYIVTPDDAHYFAAVGAVEFGRIEAAEDATVGRYEGTARLEDYLDHGRAARKTTSGSRALWKSPEELSAFKRSYRRPRWEPPRFAPGTTVEAFLGLDGGSTSTKAVLIDEETNVLAKAYRLSKGNPIEDSIEVLAELERRIRSQGATPRILGVGTTGYAKDTLKEVLQADVALVETVAHTESGLHFHPGTDVIVDVGGQDIKLIILKNGSVKDFKLNTQCSAGNGYFLQSTAQAFGVEVEDFADVAFSAERMPAFGFGCAVFMQSDIVDFQRQGWEPNEIMAGLAAVLPKNIWLYVSQVPNLAKLGTRFLLQGGTQYNLAAVKAQVDFIESRFAGTGLRPEIVVHAHSGEAGAIGCAIEARRLWAERGGESRFVGFDRMKGIEYRVTRSEATRCHFCKNRCLRTFIDVTPGERRLIVATCEKGAVEDVADMREIKKGLDAVKSANPNLVASAAREAFRPVLVEDVSDRPPMPSLRTLPWRRRALARRAAQVRRRREVRIGFPRVLNLYSHAPFFLGYFQSLGVPAKNLVFSDYTSEELYRRGAKRGAVDPCYPSKLGIAHVHDLLHVRHPKRRLSHIFFPMIDSFPSHLDNVLSSKACPALVATTEATHAAFVKEGDLFAANGIVFKKTFLNLDEPRLCARQLYDDWGEELGLSLEESSRAVRQGLQALAAFYAGLRRRAREVLDRLEREGGLGVVVLGRPYHNDPGINHDVCDALQTLGYPVFCQDALPVEEDLLLRLFGDEVRRGWMASPLSIEDVWKNSYSEHTSRKLWAAKFTARHPNLVALELSSFKCGHDAPIYSTIEEIIESSGTPYFCFKDIDENRPAASIKLRIETIAYFLNRHHDDVLREARLLEAV
jgi:predicted CoA-substrate-specific enzyme activase